jgi:hypothetical protein
MIELLLAFKYDQGVELEYHYVSFDEATKLVRHFRRWHPYRGYIAYSGNAEIYFK